MKPVRLEPAAPRSRVKHSTTEPLRSRTNFDQYIKTQTYNGHEYKILVLIALSSNEGSCETVQCADSPEPSLLAYTNDGCILTRKRNASIECRQVRHVVHKHELHELTLSKASGLRFEFLFISDVGLYSCCQ